MQRGHAEQSVTAERSAIQRAEHTGENEEEEVDIDVCVVAAVEERPVIGFRRSARLSANAGRVKPAYRYCSTVAGTA